MLYLKLGSSIFLQGVSSSETYLGDMLMFVIKTFLLCGVTGAWSVAIVELDHLHWWSSPSPFPALMILWFCDFKNSFISTAPFAHSWGIFNSLSGPMNLQSVLTYREMPLYPLKMHYSLVHSLSWEKTRGVEERKDCFHAGEQNVRGLMSANLGSSQWGLELCQVMSSLCVAVLVLVHPYRALAPVYSFLLFLE